MRLQVNGIEANTPWALNIRFCQTFAHRFDYRILVGELASLQFRVNQLSVHGNLEATASRGDQCQLSDGLLVF